MGNESFKTKQRKRRRQRVRAKIKGTAGRPRLSVFKSNKHIFVQLVDDERKKTLVASWDKAFNGESSKTMHEKAKLVGKDIALKALEKKITQVVFDRGGFSYARNLKALADAARENGLKF